MEFKLISIASIIAFYGCYFVKMFHQKAGNTDRPNRKEQSWFCEIRGNYHEDCGYSCFYSGAFQYFLKRSITLFPFGFLERY